VPRNEQLEPTKNADLIYYYRHSDNEISCQECDEYGDSKGNHEVQIWADQGLLLGRLECASCGATIDNWIEKITEK